jgi:DNA (cytosine-5)-methyltransferase 1
MISNIASARLVVPAKLNEVYIDAQAIWDNKSDWLPDISADFMAVLEFMNCQGANASTAFSNIFTSLAVKAAFPAIDIRYHQEQIQNQTSSGAGFSFRTLSEVEIYPWLRDHQFDGAKSGWQTRTYERNDPYTLAYPHQIGGKGSPLKDNFLRVYERIEEHGEDAAEALKFLVFLQIRKRHEQMVDPTDRQHQSYCGHV